MNDLTIERSFDPQATWVIDVLGLYFDIAGIKCLYSSPLLDM